jgi:hypothetical protein
MVIIFCLDKYLNIIIFKPGNVLFMKSISLFKPHTVLIESCSDLLTTI